MANQISKLAYVDAKLGAPTSGQQTTRTLYHTILGAGASTSLEFFKNFQGLTLGQTNLTQNKLDSAESMVIKTISFMQFIDQGGGTYTGSNVGVTNLTAIENMTIDVILGNQRVVKALPISFNQGPTGQSFDRLHDNGGLTSGNSNVTMPLEIRLLTDIVIPPQTEFIVRLNAPSTADFGAAVVCALSGYGRIFSAGSSF